MTATQVSDTVLSALADAAGCEPEDINATTSLRDGELLDSLDTFEAVVDIEDELGIVIQDSDLEAARTVGDLLALCERLVATRGPKA